MTRQIWSAIACIVVLGLAVAGFTGISDYYDTHDGIYALVGHLTPKARYDQAEAYGRAMQTQDLPTLKAMSDPALLNDNFYQAVPKLGVYFPAGQPTATGALQYSLTAYSDGRRISVLVINHTYANGSVTLTTTTFNEVNGKVQGFYVRLLTAADLKALRFDPFTANGTQAIMLILALAIIGFTIFTLYRCLSTPGIRWKWLWFIFITAGVCSLRFNWTTQMVQFVPFDIHWGAAGLFQLLLQPATIYLNAPVGALVFWLSGQSRVKVKPPKAA